MPKGVFIVVDGTDGSGKATQTKQLVERLAREEYSVETIAFPQYGNKSCGPVEEYLEGKYGDANDVGPYKGSVLYAVDRFDASKTIKKWLDDGKVVIADRYVGSNMGHQGSKITDPKERKAFFEWAMQFEHELMRIPRPDVNLVLHVPAETTVELTKDRALKSNLSHDVHEADIAHLKAAEQTYIEMTKQFEEFHLIECMEQDQLLTPENIHELIWDYVQTYLHR